MGWIYLALAIAFEVSGTTCMKLSHGFTRPTWGLAMFVLYVISFSLLALCLKTTDLGIAYAIWAGVGTALIAVIGFAWFGETVTPLKVVCLVLIIAGVVGLNAGAGESRVESPESRAEE